MSSLNKTKIEEILANKPINEISTKELSEMVEQNIIELNAYKKANASTELLNNIKSQITKIQDELATRV